MNQRPTASPATPLLRAAFCCLALGLVSAAASAHTRITTDITWSEDIRPILRSHCMRCHHPGGIAPSYVDLTTYGNDAAPGARAWAAAIEEELLTGRMPPWPADPRYGKFANARRLSLDERDQIVAWIRGGAPQGPRRDLPAPPEWSTAEWEIGAPDLVIELPEVTILGAGERHRVVRHRLPIDVPADTWITGFEFRPDAPHSVYRIAASLVDDPTRAGESLEVEVQVPYDPFRPADEPEPTRQRTMPAGVRFLGQWLRGDAPVLFPAGTGKRLRRGTTIELEVEYLRSAQENPNATVRDRSRLALVLARSADEVDLIAEELVLRPAPAPGARRSRREPAAAPSASGRVVIPEAARVLGFAPVVPPGIASFEIRAQDADGRGRTLLYVPAVDALWPASYRFAEPVAVAAGSALEVVATGEGAAELLVHVDYQATEHLVLPEPPRRPGPGSAGGSMLVDLFGGAARSGGATRSAPGDPPPATSATAPSAAASSSGAGSGAHMDHSPLHGGQFFMAANQYHHLEGALPAAYEFRLFVYDDWKQPIDPRNFGGRVVFEHWDQKSGAFSEETYPLEPIAGTDYLRATLPERPLPLEFFAAVWLGAQESRYDFYFTELSRDTPSERRAAVPGASAHSHQRPPLSVPADAPAIVDQIGRRRERVERQIESGEWLTLYVPAFDARDLAEALLDLLAGVPAQSVGSVRRGVSLVLQAAVELDRAGDLADAARARAALERLREGERLLAVIARPAPGGA